MEGAKAYILPVVAGVVLLAYWLLVPDADETPAVAGDSPASSGVNDKPNAEDAARAQALADLQASVGPDAGELPREYRDRQESVVRATVASCKVAEPPPYRVTLVGAPGVPARVEAIDKTGEVPASADACAQRELRALELPAPPAPGRSVLGL